MKADLTPIAPVFQKDSQAFSFCGLILLIVLLPMLMLGSGCLSMRDRFLSLNFSSLESEHDYKEIYETKSDIDVLFLGGCVITAGIDPALVQQKLSEADHSKKTVVTLGQFFGGQDLSYFMLSELLKRRKVRLIVFQTPSLGAPYIWPHQAAGLWIDSPEVLSEVPFGLRAMIYSQLVLESLRNLLSLVRPNPTACFDVPGEGLLAAGKSRNAFSANVHIASTDDFQEFHPPVPQIPLNQISYSTNPSMFAVRDEPMSNYQKGYLKRTMELIQNKKIPLLLLHMPLFNESSEKQVPERISWSAFLQPPVRLVGIPGDRLFQGISPEQKRLMYYNAEHMNVNGSEFFSNTIFGGILDAYRAAPPLK